MVYDSMVHILVYGMLWAPKHNRPTELLQKSKICQIHYGFIFFQQNLLHVVCFDAEIIQTMFSLQWLHNTVKYCPNTAKLHKLSKNWIFHDMFLLILKISFALVFSSAWIRYRENKRLEVCVPLFDSNPGGGGAGGGRTTTRRRRGKNDKEWVGVTIWLEIKLPDNKAFYASLFCRVFQHLIGS